GDKALRVVVPAGSPEPWDRIVGQSGLSVSKGKAYVLRFTARADVPTTIRVTVQQEDAPYTTTLDARVTLRTEATEVALPFTSDEDIPEAALTFQLGGGATTVFLDDVSAGTGSDGDERPTSPWAIPAPESSYQEEKPPTPQP